MKDDTIYFWIGWIVCYPVRLFTWILGGIIIAAIPEEWYKRTP